MGLQDRPTLQPPGGPLRRGLQPGVPQRRLRRQRFLEARPHRARSLLPARRGGHALTLRGHQGADPRHRRQKRRAHQARVQLLPRHQDFLHQRGRRALRESGGRRQPRGPGHGPRPPDRAALFARGAGIWGLLLPEGPRGILLAQPAEGLRLPTAQGGQGNQRAPEDLDHAKDRGEPLEPRRKDGRDAGPLLQAPHRRHALRAQRRHRPRPQGAPGPGEGL